MNTKFKFILQQLLFSFFLIILPLNLILASAPKKERSIKEIQKLTIKDLKTTYKFLNDIPPAVVFFGGSREKKYITLENNTQEINKNYADAEYFAGKLKSISKKPRVGGYEESGVMTAIVDAHIGLLGKDNFQVVNLNRWYPKEGLQKDPSCYHFVNLLSVRKWGLMQKAYAYVLVKGGPGTLNEFFEVLKLKYQHKTNAPIVLRGPNYWKNKIAALENSFKRLNFESSPYYKIYRLIEPRLKIKTTITQLTDLKNDILSTWNNKNDGLLETEDFMITAIKSDFKELKNSYNSISIISENTPEDYTNQLKSFFHHVSKNSEVVPFKVQIDSIYQQDFPKEVTKNKIINLYRPKTSIMETEYFTNKSLAAIFLPSGPKGLSQFFSMVDQMHLKEIPPRPIILIGRKFWSPIVNDILFAEDVRLNPDVKGFIHIVKEGKEVFEILKNENIFEKTRMENSPAIIKILRAIKLLFTPKSQPSLTEK